MCDKAGTEALICAFLLPCEDEMIDRRQRIAVFLFCFQPLMRCLVAMRSASPLSTPLHNQDA